MLSSSFMFVFDSGEWTIEQTLGMPLKEQSDTSAEHCRRMLKPVDEARSLLPHFRVV